MLCRLSSDSYYVVSFNNPLRHLHISHNASYLPPPKKKKKKNCVTFHFSWVLQPSQEKLKAMLMQNFEGANKVHYGRCASGVLPGL